MLDKSSSTSLQRAVELLVDSPGHLHHLVREGHTRRRVVTVAARQNDNGQTRTLRVNSTVPVVVALTSALVVTVITRSRNMPSYKEVSDTESLSCRTVVAEHLTSQCY